MSNELDEFDDEMLLDFPPYDVEELTKDEILSDLVMNFLVSLKDSPEKIKAVEKVREKAREYKLTSAFNKIYKMKEKQIGIENLNKYNQIAFPELNNIIYTSNKYQIDKKGNIWETSPNAESKLVCYHPILPIEKFENLEDGSTKIKLAFYTDNKWKYVIVDKSAIASTQAIIKLSDLGIAVNSENARFLIKYLAEMEYLNKDKIKINKSVSRLGWLKSEFIPYSDYYYYVGDLSYRNMFDSIHREGNYEVYYEEIKRLRTSSLILRFMLAVSCASPLVSLVNINTFIVHLWGKSEVGKTLMLMLCASIWGNPRKGNLLTSLNSTDVAFEMLNNFMNNIPLFLDELQTITDEKTDKDNLVYKLTEGKGKDRSNKDLVLRKTTKWNNIILLSGEQPITSSNSKEGVKNRVIEIEQNKKIVADGNSLANLIFNNYGFIGPQFIEIVKNKNNLKEEYDSIKKGLQQYCKYSKQIESMAIILLADKILSEEIFQDKPICFEEAKQFFRNDTDEADRCIDIILDYANSHINNFCVHGGIYDKEKGQLLGDYEKSGNSIKYFNFIPSVLRKHLSENNINFDGIKQKLAERGYLIDNGNEKKKEYTLVEKLNGTSQRIIKIKNIH